MKFTCSEYAGWDALVTELGAPTEVFYQGDSSSTETTLIIAYYSAAPSPVVVCENIGGVLVSALIADYASAVRVSGLQGVEV